jgi:hypothetical protein
MCHIRMPILPEERGISHHVNLHTLTHVRTPFFLTNSQVVAHIVRSGVFGKSIPKA